MPMELLKLAGRDVFPPLSDSELRTATLWGRFGRGLSLELLHMRIIFVCRLCCLLSAHSQTGPNPPLATSLKFFKHDAGARTGVPRVHMGPRPDGASRQRRWPPNFGLQHI